MQADGYFLFKDGSKDIDNRVSVRNVYPTAEAPTTGQRASATTPFSTEGGMDEVQDAMGASGVFGKPITWWAVLVVLLVALMWSAKRIGGGAAGEFGNIKLSIYNVFVIALAAAIGLGFFKVVFSRFNVPGLSTYMKAI